MPPRPPARRAPRHHRLGVRVAPVAPRRRRTRGPPIHAPAAGPAGAGRRVQPAHRLVRLLPRLPGGRRAAAGAPAKGGSRLRRLRPPAGAQSGAPPGPGRRAGAPPARAAAVRQLGLLRRSQGMKVSVILPTYNEREVIVSVVREILSAVPEAE